MNKLRVNIMLKKRYLSNMLKKRGMTFKTGKEVRIKSRIIHESELRILGDGRVEVPSHTEVIEVEVYMNRESGKNRGY